MLSFHETHRALNGEQKGYATADLKLALFKHFNNDEITLAPMDASSRSLFAFSGRRNLCATASWAVVRIIEGSLPSACQDG